MKKITYKGNTPPITPKFDIQLAGGETKDDFQPWHLYQFYEAATSGIELIFPYDDVSIEKNSCVDPFKKLSDDFYQLELDTTIGTMQNLSVVVVPHYRYYTDPDWNTPLPLFCSWQSDWWPRPFTIVFRYGLKPSIFRKGEPFAQAILIERDNVETQEMSESEKCKRDNINQSCNQYVTREWITKNGVELDNLYNVLVHRNSRGKPPFDTKKTKKFRMIRKNKC